jgi:hypothetical protein
MPARGDKAMAKYLLLYIGGQSGMGQSEAAQKAIIDDWTNWFTRLGGALVDPGNPTSPMTKTIDSNGKVSEKPAGALVTGYSIISADSFDAAMEMAKGCPHLKANGQVTVYETFNVM